MPIQFQLNKHKAVNSVLWLIQRGERDMYRIWKMLFAADKYHLNTYGRPITSDTYYAMAYGTVPAWLYDVAIEQPGVGFARAGNSLIPERTFIRELFSETDIEALEYGYKEYSGALTFGEIMDKNHKEAAWAKHWENKGQLKKVPIPYEDLVDEAWLREELEWRSYSMVI